MKLDCKNRGENGGYFMGLNKKTLTLKSGFCTRNDWIVEPFHDRFLIMA